MAKYKIDNLKNLSSKLSSEINRIGRQKLIKWNNQIERKDNPRYIYNLDGVLKINYDDNLNSLYKLNAEDYAKEILHFYSSVISKKSIYQIYDLPDKNIISSLHSYSWDIKLDWLMNQPVIFITHPKIEYSLINDLENNTLIKRGLLNSEIIKLESDIKEINGIIKNLETEYNELKLKISNIDDSNNIQNSQLDKKDNTNPNVRKNSLLNWFNKTIPSKQDQRKSTFSNIENNNKPELLEEQLKNRIIDLEKLQREKTDNENDLNKKLAKYNSLENELAQLRKIPDSLNTYINSLNNNNYKEIENKKNTIKSLINDYIENDLSGLIPYIKYLLLDC